MKTKLIGSLISFCVLICTFSLLFFVLKLILIPIIISILLTAICVFLLYKKNIKLLITILTCLYFPVVTIFATFILPNPSNNFIYLLKEIIPALIPALLILHYYKWKGIPFALVYFLIIFYFYLYFAIGIGHAFFGVNETP